MLQDYDPPIYTEIGTSQPKAKKEYKCDCCTVNIKIGEKHRKMVIKDEDGKLIQARYHFICPWEQLNS